MKKTLLGLLAAASLLAVGCRSNYDSTLADRVKKLEDDVAKLSGLQGQIDALKGIVEGATTGLYVKDVQEVKVDGVVVGFTVTFSDGTKDTVYTITNGKDGNPGENGSTPEISVKLDGGVYYWTVDGEFILDSAGNKVPATGATPQIKIEDGKWKVSVDGGATWTECGDATVINNNNYDDSVFSTVLDNTPEGYVTFVLKDGTTTIVLPKEQAFALVFPKYKGIGIGAGETIEIEYTVTGAIEGTVVDALATSAGYEAAVTPVDYKSGSVVVTAPDPITAGSVLVWADNLKGKTSIKALSFEVGVDPTYTVEIGDVDLIPADGETIEIAVVSNKIYSVVIEKAAESWIHLVQTKAVETSTLVFEVDANDTAGDRTGKVEIVGTDDVVYQTITFYQEAPAEAELEVPIVIPSGSEDYAAIAPTADNRVFAIDERYVYLPKQNKGILQVVPLTNFDKVKEVPVTMAGGTHNLSGIALAKKADGSSVILLSNLAIGNTFKVTKMEGPSGTPEEILSYTITNGNRLGDKISFEGTWENGELIAVDYGSGHSVNVFKVTNGEIAQTPVIYSPLKGDEDPDRGNAFSTLMKYSDTEYIYSASNMSFTPTIYTRSSEGFADPVLVKQFSRNMGAVRFFHVADKDYIAFASFLNGSYTYVDIAVLAVDRSKTLAENLEGKTADDLIIIPLLHEQIHPNTMGCIDINILVKDEKAYIAGLVYDNIFAIYEFSPSTGTVIGPGDATVVPGGDF